MTRPTFRSTKGLPVCKAIPEGGQRCASHTRPAFHAVEARIVFNTNDELSDAAWTNARIKRNQDLHLAAPLALHDPDPVERLAAAGEVTAQPPEALTQSTAIRLATNLDSLPLTQNFNGPTTIATHLGTWLTTATNTGTELKVEVADRMVTSEAGRTQLVEAGILKLRQVPDSGGWFREPKTHPIGELTIDDQRWEVSTTGQMFDPRLLS